MKIIQKKIINKGFTLLEVLVSLTILALVFTGTMFAVNESISRFSYITKKTFFILDADAILTQYKIKALNLPKETTQVSEKHTRSYNPKGSWILSRESGGVKVKIINEHRNIVFELKAYE